MSRADRSKSFASIGQALDHARDPVLREAAARYRALSPLNAAWQRAVDHPLRQHARPASLRDGILTVHAESPVWANLLRNSEQSLVIALRGAGLDSVRGLRIRISPPNPSPEKAPAAEPEAGENQKFSRFFEQMRKALG